MEETQTGFSAYLPDIDGCIATGQTIKEVEVNIKEALEFHLEGLRLENKSLPIPHSYSNYIQVSA